MSVPQAFVITARTWLSCLRAMRYMGQRSLANPARNLLIDLMLANESNTFVEERRNHCLAYIRGIPTSESLPCP
jgi:hypothetical protein